MAGGAPTPPAVAASAVGSAGARAAGSVAASGEAPGAGSVVVSVVGSAAPAVAAAGDSDPVDADGSDLLGTGALSYWARAALSSCQHGPFAGEFYPGLTTCTPGLR